MALLPSIDKVLDFRPASIDEAINFTRALDIFQTDTLRNFALNGINSANPILDRYAKISQLAALVRARIFEGFKSISIAGLDQTPKTLAGLKDFFNKDGPFLGENLADAISNISALTKGGVYINSRHEVPVLTEVDKKDKSAVIKTLSWIGADELENISNFPRIEKVEFPGSVTHSFSTKDSDGKITSETRYTVFIEYANMRTSLDSLTGVIDQLRDMLAEVGTQISIELNFIKKASNGVDEILESSETFNKNQVKISEKIEAAALATKDASFKLEQILIRERQLLMALSEKRFEVRKQFEKLSNFDIKISSFPSRSEVGSVLPITRHEDNSESLPISIISENNKVENQSLAGSGMLIIEGDSFNKEGTYFSIKNTNFSLIDEMAAPNSHPKHDASYSDLEAPGH